MTRTRYGIARQTRARLPLLGLVALAVVAIAFPPTGAAATSDVWRAKVGASGANGTATLTAPAAAAGTLKLVLKALTPSSAYAVKVVKGTCTAPGTAIWSAGTQRSTSAGKIAKSITVPTAKMTAIRTAAAAGPVALRVGAGTKLRCGPFTGGPTPTATPTPSASPSPSASASPSPSAGGTMWVGPYFALGAPAGWTVGPSVDGTAVTFRAPGGQLILAHSVQSSLSLDEETAQIIARFHPTFGDPEQTESLTMDGVPGRLLTYHFLFAGSNRHLLEALCVKNGRLYEINFNKLAGTESVDRALFLSVLASFVFLNAPD